MRTRTKQRGGAVVEAALLLPWIAFLFVGLLDFGYYAYAAIATQNAARAVAVVSTTTSATRTPCQAALAEMRVLPNMGVSVTTCATAKNNITAALPLAVPTPVSLDCATTPKCADCTTGACAKAVEPRSVVASVTYQTIPMIPIPGLLTGQMTLTRTVEMRVLE